MRAALAGHTRVNRVKFTAGRLNETHLLPFGYLLLDFFPMCIQDLELLYIDGFFGAAGYLVQDVVCGPEIQLLSGHQIVMLEKGVKLLWSKLLRHVEGDIYFNELSFPIF
jgi:hypothetical protein